jgi:hypothetical protein
MELSVILNIDATSVKLPLCDINIFFNSSGSGRSTSLAYTPLHFTQRVAVLSISAPQSTQ